MRWGAMPQAVRWSARWRLTSHADGLGCRCLCRCERKWAGVQKLSEAGGAVGAEAAVRKLWAEAKAEGGSKTVGCLRSQRRGAEGTWTVRGWDRTVRADAGTGRSGHEGWVGAVLLGGSNLLLLEYVTSNTHLEAAEPRSPRPGRWRTPQCFGERE